MFQLHVTSGPAQGTRYDLTEGEYVLGRDPTECQIVIKDVPAVSRKHARLFKSGNSYAVEDLKSRNKTYLNAEPDGVQEARLLRHGDQIRICEVNFVFQSGVPLVPPGKPTKPLDGANLAEMSEDEHESQNSTILKSFPVDISSSSQGGVRLTASPEVKLAALIEITQNLGRALSLDEVLPQVLKSLFKIFVQADRGFIVLQTPDGKLIPRWVRLRREDANDTVRISRTIIRKVMESKQAILSADAATDDRFEMSQSIADFRIRSMMCAPLMDSEGNAMGALQIDTLNQRQKFQGEDLELLVSAAGQASISIQNAAMHDASLRQKEVERDMQLAKDVQRGFLPESRPDLAGYEFFDYYEPAEQVGGDYFDYIPLPDGRIAIVVADVVGHGVAAALLMAKLSAEARFSLYTEHEPAAAITVLNDKLARLNIQRFVTLVCAVLDPKTHKLTIVNAGHMAPLVRRKNGTIDEPGEAEAGMPLGITDGIIYQQVETTIGPGETVTLYTDGINESIDKNDAFYTIDRMRKLAKENDHGPDHYGRLIVDDVRRFLTGAVQNDDMCLVSFGRK
ncbi:MAG: SpoIIE family protein phosphatase [Pirellulaceae bacterium]